MWTDGILGPKPLPIHFVSVRDYSALTSERLRSSNTVFLIYSHISSNIFLEVVNMKPVKLSRDAKDDYYLSLCKEANIDFLITGDKG